jgi:hypothetical protein
VFFEVLLLACLFFKGGKREEQQYHAGREWVAGEETDPAWLQEAFCVEGWKGVSDAMEFEHAGNGWLWQPGFEN